MKSLSVAIVGASHWHVPLYVKGIKQLDIDVCGIEDADQIIARNIAQDCNTVAYDNIDKLLDETKPDFVFAFAKHNEMPVLARKLIEREIAFTLEKPAGMNYQEVQELANLAQSKNVFCSIPFVWRYSEAVESIKSRIDANDFIHLAFRFVAGPPQRYLVNGSPWMLEASHAGGGCMTNLAPHFLDLALYLTESINLKVLSATHHYYSNYSVEDYSIIQLVNEKGVSISLETGYAYPMSDHKKRENEWKIVTKGGYHTLSDNNFEFRYIDKPVENHTLITDSDELYPIFVERILNDWLSGRKPHADLSQMAHVRKILDEVIEKAAVKLYQN